MSPLPTHWRNRLYECIDLSKTGRYCLVPGFARLSKLFLLIEKHGTNNNYGIWLIFYRNYFKAFDGKYTTITIFMETWDF